MLRYGSQSIDETDVEAVIDVLRSSMLTQGPVGPRFEHALCAYTGAPHAVAVSSGTAALHLACLAAGVGPGDSVWCPAITFAATANAARFCRANIGFVDIDPATFNVCVDGLDRKLQQTPESERPRAVTAVHLAGLPCDMEGLRALADQYGFRLIEDACHALGGCYADGSRVGGGGFGDAAAFSFHAVKPITTGEGGMVLTRHEDWAERMRLLRSHGITRDPDRLRQPAPGPWYYEQLELGFNYRLTDLQAALGLSQLKRLDEFQSRREALAGRYREALAGLPVALQQPAPGKGRSGWHLLVIRLLDEVHQSRKAELAARLHDAGIGTNLHYIPVYRHPDYADGTDWPAQCPGAEQYYREALTLPLHPTMNPDDVDHVAETLRRLLQEPP